MGINMHVGWMKAEMMCKENSSQSQESVGTCEITLDVLKSQRNETNCVPAKVKATGF